MRNLMTCPQCKETMISEAFGSAWVEVCRGCQGLWFDQGELGKLDAQKKGAGPALDRALREATSERPEEARFECPLCAVELGHFRHELAPEVEYDECPTCNGLFLRAGELGRLRRREATNAERAARRARIRRTRERARERTLQRGYRDGLGNTSAVLLLLSLLDD